MTDSPRSTVVISIDAVAPRYVTPDTMPNLVALGRAGAACYRARTVNPPITMPAHISLLRGIDPSVHGVLDNTATTLTPEAAAVPTFLERVRRDAGLDTASVVSWAPMDAAVDRGAVSTRMLFDDGYNPDIDDVIVDRLIELVTGGRHGVIFGYLIAPDLAGHDHGWGSNRYLEALRRVDAAFGRLATACGPDDTLIVTTDHGGLGTDHGVDRPEDMEIFVAARSPLVAPGSIWSSASILDVAPTVAELSSVDPHPAWRGTSLLGRERRLVDVLGGLVDDMAAHTYGERVTMRDHALQTASNARAVGASSSMIAAALLHDIGHLTDDAGAWGLPDHAEEAGRMWQALLPPEVVEPIRLHVAAKRWLVANDPDYRARLSEASLVTLDQQGGPFDAIESTAFLARPFAAEAIELRRWTTAASGSRPTAHRPRRRRSMNCCRTSRRPWPPVPEIRSRPRGPATPAGASCAETRATTSTSSTPMTSTGGGPSPSIAPPIRPWSWFDAGPTSTGAGFRRRPGETAMPVKLPPV